MDFVDYIPIVQFMPLDKISDQTSRFVKSEMNEILYSLIAKVYVTDDLEIVVHKSFTNVMTEVTNRGAVRGHDYVVFPLINGEGYHIHARIDRNFISPEDVINE